MNRVKFSVLVVSLGLLPGLTACGGGDDSSSAGPGSSQGPDAPPSLPAAIATKPAAVAAAAQIAAISAEQKAQPCLSCHSIDSFAGMDAAALEASMQAMRNGEIAHLPLPDSLSDQDLADIATYLAEAAG